MKGADVDESSLAKVPNADTLDGLDASAFAQGPGTTQFSGGTIADATTDQLLLTLDIETLDADCNTGTPSLIYTNQSGGTAIVIRESRGDELTLIGRLTVATLAA